MTQHLQPQHQLPILVNPHLIHLKILFPRIQHVVFDQIILNSPLLKKLVNLIKFSIPVHTFQPQILKLYENITEKYYSQILQIPAALRPDISSQQEIRNNIYQDDANTAETTNEDPQQKFKRSRFNYLQMARFIEGYNNELNSSVDPALIQQVEIFDQWMMKEVRIKEGNHKDFGKRHNKKYETEYVQKVQEKEKKSQIVGIMLGRNISLQAKLMKNQLIKRAQNNKFLTCDQSFTKIQKIETQINYILNRITQDYFNDFLAQLLPYAEDELHSIILCQKIIEKIVQEHNYIELYTKLIKAMKKITIVIDNTKIKFKEMFTSSLQTSFYKLMRARTYKEKEQLYKKHIIGISLFIGQLIKQGILSKNIFKDCFYELITSYIQEYYLHVDNKSYYLYEIFVECIIKIIEKMGGKYDRLIKKKGSESLQDILEFLLKNYEDKSVNFSFSCNYIDLLKEINVRLPSQRYKIKFLLEDFRCNLALRKNTNSQHDEENKILKELFEIDPTKKEKIKGMIENLNAKKLMGKFLMQFAQGNLNQVNKNIEIYKSMIKSAQIAQATLNALKENIQNLFTIECDYPFLSQGLGQIVKITCDDLGIEWRSLDLRDDDEDVMEFIEKIQSKYYKLIVED